MGCKIVIQSSSSSSSSSSTIIQIPPIVTYIDTTDDIDLTWSELCRRTIENDYLHSSNHLLTLLMNIHGSTTTTTTTYTTAQSQQLQPQPQQQQQQQQQFVVVHSAYRLRYDLGLGTIIKPTWSSSLRRGVGAQRTAVVLLQKQDKEDAYMDVNVSLQSVNNGLEFEPHETILSSIKGGRGRGGVEDDQQVLTTTTTTTPTTKFVNLYITTVGYGEKEDGNDNVHPTFPITKEMTRILICKEDDYYSGYIDSYNFIDNDDVGMMDNNCHFQFLSGGAAGCSVNYLRDRKEEEEEEEEEAEYEIMKSSTRNQQRINNDAAADDANAAAAAALNKTDEEELLHQVSDSVSGGIGSGEEREGIIETRTGTSSPTQQPPMASSLSLSKEVSIFTLDTPFSVGASAGRKRRRRQQQRGEESPTTADCKSTTAVIKNGNVTRKKSGDDPSSQDHTKIIATTTTTTVAKAESSLQYLKKKQAELRVTEKSSIIEYNARGGLSKAAPECEDAVIVAQVPAISKTSKTICANSNVLHSTEEAGDTAKIIKLGKNSKSTKGRDQGGKTNAPRSRAGSITSFNSSESIIPAGESDKHIPSKMAVGFPPGWTTRLIPRVGGNIKRGDNRYYSPKLEYRFPTKGTANEFVKLLEQTKGDEKETMMLYTKRGRGKKNAVDVLALSTVDTLDSDGDNNTAKAIVVKSKRMRRTNNTKIGVKERCGDIDSGHRTTKVKEAQSHPNDRKEYAKKMT